MASPPEASLIEDLARRLDASPGEARQRLQDLLHHLRSEADRDGQATLPGLGTFTPHGDTWTFEPAEALARSTNRSFGDLEPIDIAASALPDDAPPAGAEAAAAEEKTTAREDEAAGPPPPGDADRALRQAGASVFDRHDEEDTSAKDASAKDASAEERAGESRSGQSLPAWSYAALPAGSLAPRRRNAPSADALRSGALQPLRSGVSSHVDAPSHASPAAERPEEPAATYDGQPEPRADRRAAAPGREQQRAQQQQQEEQDGNAGMLRWAAAALALLAVASLGLWLALGPQDAPPETEPVRTAQQQMQQQQQQQTAAAGTTAGSAAPAGDSAAPAGDSAAPAAATEPAPSPAEQAFAQAPRLDRAQGGWTIVVASETSREAAERVAGRFAQRLQEQPQGGYPIDVLASTVEGRQRYRVVVGQFASADAAIQVFQQDAGRFPEGAWALELEPGDASS